MPTKPALGAVDRFHAASNIRRESWRNPKPARRSMMKKVLSQIISPLDHWLFKCSTFPDGAPNHWTSGCSPAPVSALPWPRTTSPARDFLEILSTVYTKNPFAVTPKIDKPQHKWSKIHWMAWFLLNCQSECFSTKWKRKKHLCPEA